MKDEATKPSATAVGAGFFREASTGGGRASERRSREIGAAARGRRPCRGQSSGEHRGARIGGDTPAGQRTLVRNKALKASDNPVSAVASPRTGGQEASKGAHRCARGEGSEGMNPKSASRMKKAGKVSGGESRQEGEEPCRRKSHGGGKPVGQVTLGGLCDARFGGTSTHASTNDSLETDSGC